MPRFEYLLDDLTAERAEALRSRPGPPLARLAWLVLRYGRTEELAHRLPEWTALFAQVRADPDGTENLVVVIRYLLWVGDKTTYKVTKRVLHSMMDEPQVEELMRSHGEVLIERGIRRGLERGRAEGLAEGRLRGRAESLLRILAARSVHVGDEAQQRILACADVATLDRWLDRALNATHLSDVLDEPAS
ncbi:RpnC/YadD family protein [Archangium lipolyticum]|uniref:hypothetical protein n=1 Tax=Archangium lipolyticum TaxID=2970465 RepID=UPI00214A1988|nr:hypothetical protein [Archangium lipolyticum]